MSCPFVAADIVPRWAPRERLPVPDWAVANRVLSPRASPSHPGPWKHLAPWMAGLMTLMGDGRISFLVVLKNAQGGISELVRCTIGQWADLDPGPVLWVMTTKEAAKKAMRKLGWLLEDTPCLSALRSPRKRDNTVMGASLLNGMDVDIAWSGSPQAMASDPYRRVILDEVAKYKTIGADGEANAVMLSLERIKVFGRQGKLILLSSPKHEDDLICQNYDETLDKRRFVVPCPGCRELQPLDWEWVRWGGGDPSSAPADARERAALATEIEKAQGAWVECRNCGEKIDARAAMNDPEAAWVRVHTSESGEDSYELDPPPSRRVAVHISELYHWKTTTSDLCAKFLRCNTPNDLQGFFNGSLGLPYKDASAELRPQTFLRRAIHPYRVAPDWASCVLSSADTQGDHFWFMIRAWGSDGRSRLLDWGRVNSFEELEERCLRQEFQVEGTDLRVKPVRLAIDTGGGMVHQDGSRTHDVYQFANRTPGVIPCKGEGQKDPTAGTPLRQTTVTYTPPNRVADPLIQRLHLCHANYWKDHLAALIRSEEPVLWEECRGVDHAYARQMTGQHRVLEVSTRGSRWIWRKRKGMPDHLWDCAYLQCVAAEIVGVRGQSRIVEEARGSQQAAEEYEDRESGWAGPGRYFRGDW